MIGLFFAKYATFDLKKYRGVYFMALKSRAKFEGKLTCGIENDMRNLAKIFIRTLENIKIGIFMGSFCPKYKMHELQLTEEL